VVAVSLKVMREFSALYLYALSNRLLSTVDTSIKLSQVSH